MLELSVPENLQAGLVSIGLPVYNGDRYLREALESLVTQDYPNFEIIISDNGSDDETEAICHEYAARDTHIRYYRSAQNMGPIWNFRRTYELARGEYFMLAAHDDRRDPRCLRLCVQALEKNPRAVMCCMEARMIDEDGHDISNELSFFKPCHPVGSTPRERVLRLAHSSTWLGIYGMFRTPIIAETSLRRIVNRWGGDIIMQADVCLRGEVVAVPEVLFDYRIFRAKTLDRLAEMQTEWGGEQVLVSSIGIGADLMECVQRAPINLVQRLVTNCALAVEVAVSSRFLSLNIRWEGLAGVRRALRRGGFRRTLRVILLLLLSQTTGFFVRIKNSAKYRGGMFSAKVSSNLFHQR